MEEGSILRLELRWRGRHALRSSGEEEDISFDRFRVWREGALGFSFGLGRHRVAML